MSTRQKRIPPQPKDKKSYIDDSSETHNSNNDVKNEVQEPDWEDFPDFESKFEQMMKQEIEKRKDEDRFKISTLLQTLELQNQNQ